MWRVTLNYTVNIINSKYKQINCQSLSRLLQFNNQQSACCDQQVSIQGFYFITGLCLVPILVHSTTQLTVIKMCSITHHRP